MNFTRTLILSLITSCLLHFAYAQRADSLNEQFNQTLFLLGQKQFRPAVSGLQDIIRHHPEYGLAYRELAQIFIDHDLLQEGEAFFHEQIKKDPVNGYAYYGLARLSLAGKKYKTAIDLLKKCLRFKPFFAEAYDKYGGLFQAYSELDKLDELTRYYEQLLEQQPDNAQIYSGLGHVYQKQGDWNRAIEFYNKALALDSLNKYTHSGMAFIYEEMGRFKDALRSGEKLLQASMKENDLSEYSYALTKIGGFYWFMGDYRQALVYFQKALKIASKIDARLSKSIAVNNIGIVYAILGNYKMALKYFNYSLDLVKESGPPSIMQIRVLYNLGLLSKDSQDYDAALDYFQQAIDLTERLGYSNEKTYMFTGIGETYFYMGQFRQARSYYEQALSLARELGDRSKEGYIQTNLGAVYQQLDDFNQAEKYLKNALRMGQQLNDSQILWEAHSGLGSIYQNMGDDARAISHYSTAVAIYDSIRLSLDFETLGSGFLEDKADAYPGLIRLYAQNRQFSQALLVSEKYRVRTMLRLITQGQPLLNSLLPDTLRSRISDLNAALNDVQSQLAKELARSQPDQARTVELDQRATEIQMQKSRLRKSIRSSYSPLFQITNAEPVHLKYVQRSILKKNQAVIQYIFTDDRLLCFVITKDSVHYEAIEVDRKSVADQITRVSPVFDPGSAARNQALTGILNADIFDFSLTASYDLYQTIFAPLEAHLSGQEQLVIVPDDLLFFVPFDALVTDTSAITHHYDFDKASYLLEKYEISYSSSLSVLDPRLRRQRQASFDLLAIGNPDFSGYVQSGEGATARTAYRPLPQSESEVRAIADLFSPGREHIFIGGQASEESFKKWAAGARIVHLASHFLLNDFDPFYSKLVLSRKDSLKEDGYLHPYEIFQMKLNADLAVLSACNSALGRLHQGEGMIGLSRAFLYAGVPSMLLSLWQVDDAATRLIMESFYSNLAEGLNMGAAIRRAKLDYLASVRSDLKDPYYWAPFILIGADQPLPIEKRRSFGTAYATVTILFLLSAVIVILRRRRLRR